MRIVFMGTPEFATAPLGRLLADGHEIAGVYTQKDKPKNRGMRMQPSPVKELALAHGIQTFTPDSLKDPQVQACLRDLRPELIVVAAYGKLLPEVVLELPPLGCINVHTSLLPKLRGAAPIQWAIVNGETETGVTIMHMAKELDAGDIIDTEKTEIGPNETAESLHNRLMELGASLLSRTVAAISRGEAKRTPQNHALATYAPRLERSHGEMDLTRPAQALHNQVRGLYPWPGAAVELQGKRLKVLETRLPGESSDEAPGTLLPARKEGLPLVCGDAQVLLLTRVQAEGGKPMAAAEYARGHFSSLQ